MMEKERSIGVTLLSLCFIVANLTVLFSMYIPLDYFPCFLLNPVCLFGQNIGTMLSLMFLLLGVFLFMLKEIARKIFLFIQAVFIIFYVCFAFFGAAFATGHRKDLVTFLAYLVYLLLILNTLPAIFIIFFTRPKVKEQFN